MTASARMCPTCNAPLAEDALFCSRCGASTPTGISQKTGAVEAAPPRSEVVADQRARLQRALGESYEVLDLLGSGGFAEVYAASDKRLKRSVAVKVLRTDLAFSPAQLQRFQREAEAVATLRHPNIVPIYTVGEGEGLAYYVMPLIQGESLRTRVEREGALPVDETVRILKELASALAAAHKVALVHRDIKPDNVMLEGEERRVLLMDFGIAKALGSAEAGLTGTGMIVGTPQYMSPEQASGEREIDHRSDLYSLGVMGWQMLVGRLPFEGDSAQMVLMKQITVPAERVDQVREDTPAELADAIERCLAKQPAERWTSAGELLASLEGLATPGAARARPRALPRLRRWYRTRAGLAALAVVVVGLGYLGLFNRHVLWAAMDYWFGFVQVPSAASVAETEAGLWYRGWNPQDRNRLVSLGDTLLLVVAPRNEFMGLAFFNGTAWRTVRMPSGRVGHAVGLGSGALLLFEGQYQREEGAGASFRLERGVMAFQDSVPFAVNGVWSDGEQVVVAGTAGEIAARSNGTWRREPTGTRQPLGEVLGPSRDDLYVIGRFARAGRPDSLLHFDGFRWRAIDIRPDTAVRWVYNAGAVLQHGELVVVGYTGGRGSALAERRPLILLRDSARAWRELPTLLPRGVRLAGVSGRARTQLLVWASPSRQAEAEPTLFEVSGVSVSPVAEVAGFAVAGAGTLRGQPYVLLEDGTLWTKRRGGWGVVGEVPGSRVLDAVFDSSVGVTVGDGLFHSWGFGQLSLDTSQTFIRAVVRGPAVWLLASSGRVYEQRCRALPGVECHTRLLPPPGPQAPTDLGMLPNGRPFVVGPAGLVASWSGSGWASMPVPASAAGEDLVRLSAERGRTVTVLGRRSLLQLDSAGAWAVVATLPAELGTPRHVATFSHGGVAIVGDRDVGLWSPRHGVVSSSSFSIRPSSISRVLALSDGRLVVATAEADDPLLGGALWISTQVADSTREIRWRAIAGLPPRVDVYGLTQYGELLHVTGSGWFHAVEYLNRLTSEDSASSQ